MKIQIKVETATGYLVLRTGDWADVAKTQPVVYTKEGKHKHMSLWYWRNNCRKIATTEEQQEATRLLTQYAKELEEHWSNP